MSLTDLIPVTGSFVLDSGDPGVSPHHRGDLIPPDMAIPTEVLTAADELRESVCEDFRRQRRGCHYNEPRFGVSDDDPWGLYQTDYYTHVLIERALAETTARGKQVEHRPWWMRTSLGVHVVAETDQGVLLTRRSQKVAYPAMWQVSAVESVSNADSVLIGNPAAAHVDLAHAARRAVSEELGVKAHDVELLDHLVDTVNGQDNILATARITGEPEPSWEVDQVIAVSDLDGWMRNRDMTSVAFQTISTYQRAGGLSTLV